MIKNKNLLKEIENKNISVDIRDEKYAEFILDYLSYSTMIKGYKNTSLIDENSRFKSIVTTKELAQLYLVDCELSSILLKYILHIEQFLNTSLSTVIVENFGINTTISSEDIETNKDDYLYKGNYRAFGKDKDKVLSVLGNFKRLIQTPNKGTSLEYYMKNKNYIPPWILLNSIFLTNSISLFHIMKSEHKEEVMNNFLKGNYTNNEKIKQRDYNIFSSSLYTIVDFRNKLAQPGLLFKHTSRDRINFGQVRTYFDNKFIVGSKDKVYRDSAAFSIILSIVIILNKNMIFKLFCSELIDFFSTYEKEFSFMDKDIYYIFKVPKNLKVRLERIMNQ